MFSGWGHRQVKQIPQEGKTLRPKVKGRHDFGYELYIEDMREAATVLAGIAVDNGPEDLDEVCNVLFGTPDELQDWKEEILYLET